jgi:hypothetical protein
MLSAVHRLRLLPCAKNRRYVASMVSAGRITLTTTVVTDREEYIGVCPVA